MPIAKKTEKKYRKQRAKIVSLFALGYKPVDIIKQTGFQKNTVYSQMYRMKLKDMNNKKGGFFNELEHENWLV